jgi:hypothetical protein
MIDVVQASLILQRCRCRARTLARRLAITLCRAPCAASFASPVRPGRVPHGCRGNVLLQLQLLRFEALRRPVIVYFLLLLLLALLLSSSPPGLLFALFIPEPLKSGRVHVRGCGPA